MIRRATETDIPAIVELVYELADYENLRHECRLTGEQLHRALFAQVPTVYAMVAELDEVLVGIAIYFLNFSTWEGTNGIYLEDLFVRPGVRGRGVGRGLIAHLAAECVEHGYQRLEWSVLTWNTPSIAFYESLGARAQTGWATYRLTGKPLAALAAHT